MGGHRSAFVGGFGPELCKGSCSSSVRRIEHTRDTHYSAVAVGSAGSQNYGERVDEKILPGTDHTSWSLVEGVWRAYMNQVKCLCLAFCAIGRFP